MSYANTALESERWKDKYRKLIKEWENNEESWRQAERALRKCVARLSVIGQGLDPELDSQLSDLRDAVHSEQDLDALSSVLDATVTTADRVIQSPRETTDAAAIEPPVSEELQEFLLQVTERLREIDTCLKQNDHRGDESIYATENMNESVRLELAGIRDSVVTENDVEHLRQSVQSRLATIQDALVEHIDNQKAHRQKSKSEIGRLLTRLSELESESNELRTQVIQERLRASLDSLTGLYNRAAFDERLEQEVARCERYQSALSAIMWDVDHFKKINDTYGHQVGDKILKAIADVLTKVLRETDFSARYGGEEFVSLLPETKLAEAQALAEQIRRGIENCNFSYRDNKVNVTISGGVTCFQESDDPEAIVVRADKALYEAKRAGRNRIEVGK